MTMTVHEFIDRYKTPKTALAEMIGIHRVELYAYLDPPKYAKADVRLGEKQLAKIAAFEGRSLRAVRTDYEKRVAA